MKFLTFPFFPSNSKKSIQNFSQTSEQNTIIQIPPLNPGTIEQQYQALNINILNLNYRKQNTKNEDYFGYFNIFK